MQNHPVTSYFRHTFDFQGNPEATNLNRDSTLGQVIGTSGSLLGVPDGAGYRDVDITLREKHLILPESKGGRGLSLADAPGWA